MSPYPQATVAATAQSLAGAGIQSTYADTGNGTGVDVGAWPRCVVSGALAKSGSIGTFTVRLAALFKGNAAPVAIMSVKPDSTTPATEHTYTSAGDFCLLTSNHAGGVVYVQVKGNVDGTSGDSFSAYVQGVTP